MHELTTAQALISTALAAAEGEHAKRIKAIYLEIGELAMLNPGQLRFCLEACSKGTVLEGAKLEISLKKGSYSCEKCGSKGDLPRAEGGHTGTPSFYCPECGSQIEVTSGRQCFVKSIDVEI